MAVQFVCSANQAQRFSCNSGCRDCGYLIHDRRYHRSTSYADNFADRRYLNTWIPYSLRMAGGVPGGLRPASVTRPPASTLWTLPLLMMAVLILFNLLDAALTARALSLGVAEGNPVMDGIFQTSVPLGMALKSLFVAGGAFALWWYRELPLAMRGMMVLTVCYAGVVIYHLAFQLALM